MKTTLDARLNQIIPRITADEFLNSAGLGNEIGFYIFDYPPESELLVRGYLDFITEYLPKAKPGLRFTHINLFELLVGYLKKRKLYDKCLDMQAKKGSQALLKALQGVLSPEKIAQAFVEAARPGEHDLIFVSRVGSAYPILRSHNLLNNLQPFMGKTPLVIFYPGVYTGQGLKLFGRLERDNYYRAFKLIH
jgi:hypothetical protein